MRICGRKCTRRFFCLSPACCKCPSLPSTHEFNLEQLFPIIDFLVRRVLGRVLFIIVYCLLIFILVVAGAIVIPYESLHKPAWLIYLLVLFAVYIAVNLFFHYFKACIVKPGSPRKSDRLPQCLACKNYKPPNAHHCSICNICVLNMDHHCIWINQCVGAKNHRFFLQFIASITFGAGTFVLAAYNTFYYNYWRAFATNQMFCDSNTLAENSPWFEWVCGQGPTLVVSTIFFTYLLCVIVFFLVGGLFYWNFVLISCGETYLGVLIRSAGFSRVYQMAFFPFRNPRFRSNWRRFLGLERGKRTFFRHILFPSSHEARGYSEWDGVAGKEEEDDQLEHVDHGMGRRQQQQGRGEEEEDVKHKLLPMRTAEHENENGNTLMDV